MPPRSEVRHRSHRLPRLEGCRRFGGLFAMGTARWARTISFFERFTIVTTFDSYYREWDRRVYNIPSETGIERFIPVGEKGTSGSAGLQTGQPLQLALDDLARLVARQLADEDARPGAPCGEPAGPSRGPSTRLSSRREEPLTTKRPTAGPSSRRRPRPPQPPRSRDAYRAIPRPRGEHVLTT